MTVAPPQPGLTLSLSVIGRRALLDALIALVLFSLMVGIRTDEGAGIELTYVTRFSELATVIGLVFCGSILVSLLRIWRNRESSFAAPRQLATITHSIVANTARLLAPALLVFAVLFPILFHNNGYGIGLGIQVLTYVLLGWGLNIVVGLAGLLVLGYIAFYAIGAYACALLATYFGWSFWVCLPLAGIVAALAGILLGFPGSRLRGDYLAIVTLAFGEIVRLIIINWDHLTGGPNGLGNIPSPTLFGIPVNDSDQGLAALLGIPFSPNHRFIYLYYLVLALALITNWVTIRLRRLPIGRAWEALREDEVACRALGINITTTKLTAFATAAMFGGFAGALFASRVGFISPESFTFQESALVLAIVVLGGMGSQLGTALAAIALILLPEMFRDFGSYRMLVFGLAMVLIMALRPRGLIGERSPTIVLEPSVLEPVSKSPK